MVSGARRLPQSRDEVPMSNGNKNSVALRTGGCAVLFVRAARIRRRYTKYFGCFGDSLSCSWPVKCVRARAMYLRRVLPDSFGEVTTADALIVLKQAVGQDVELICCPP